MATSREMGKRGISSQSGYADQYLAEQVNPIKQFYTGQETEVGLQKETDLLNIAQKIDALPGELEKQLSDLDLAIAEAKAGNSDKAVTILMSMGSAKTQAEQFSQTLAQSSNQFEQQQSQENTQFNQNLTLEQQKLAESIRQANLQNSKSGESTKESTQITTARNDVLSKARSGWTLADLQAAYGAKLGVDTVVQLYASVSPYGMPTEAYAQKILGITNSL
jgi:hypothetical protein